MLGIVIGVGSVIVMIGIGTGSKQAALTVIQKMGSNTLIIFNGGAVANSRMGPMAVGAIEVFKEEDAALIEEELSHSSVLAATPQVRTSSSVVFQNINYLTTVQGLRWPSRRSRAGTFRMAGPSPRPRSRARPRSAWQGPRW